MQLALAGIGDHGTGNTVGAEDGHGVGRDFVEFFDKTRAFFLQSLYYVLVMHNLMPHEHRRAVLDEGAVDDLDRAHHAGTEAAGLSQNHLHRVDPLTLCNGFQQLGWQDLRSQAGAAPEIHQDHISVARWLLYTRHARLVWQRRGPAGRPACAAGRLCGACASPGKRLYDEKR
ncbi:hypothetical protein D9M69_444480 [compost metagenome]